MAKTSRRSGRRTGTAGSRTRVARAAKKTGKARKVRTVPKARTAGKSRTATKARTAVALEAVAADDTVDACDIDFTTGEATPDSELPLARGGVETVRPAGRR